jgi:peptide/nickel transport system permease protein
MAVVDIMLAFPTLVLALAIVAVLGRGLTNACIAITVVAIPAFARITRANTLSYAEREFVTAARVMGAKNTRIMIREILPNVIFPVVAFALVAIAVAIVAEGSLAFLSLSVKDPNASWGQMILDGRGVIDEWPHVSLIPSAIMFVTVLAFNLLGEQFRQIFNVRDAAL